MCLKKAGKGYKEVDKTNLYLAPYYKSLVTTFFGLNKYGHQVKSLCLTTWLQNGVVDRISRTGLWDGWL